MSRAFFTMVLAAAAMVGAFMFASVPSVRCAFNDMCDVELTQCMDSCEGLEGQGKSHNDGSPYAKCMGQCAVMYDNCFAKGSSGSSIGNNPHPTNPTGTPPKRWGGNPPVNVGGNKQPVGGGGSSPPKVPIGLHPTNPVGVAEPGTGTTGTGSGETIYAKGGTVKPPVVTTSPIGLTTTTVYDEKGNSTSMLTDPTGKILSKTTTMLGLAGGTTSTTTNAEGKILSTTTKTPDGKGGYLSVIRNDKGEVTSSATYDRTGKIVSQSAKIITSTTGTGGNYSIGKGHKEGFLGEGSQKYKEKGMNQLFHEEKQKLNEQNSGSASGSSNFSAHPHGGHR